MPTFRYSFLVNASLDAVAEFHRDTRALRTLSPTPVQLHRVDPMGEGSISEFTLWFGPFPIHWRAVHSEVSENGFTDTQEDGPMAYWAHTHSFEALNENQTRISDKIEYRYLAGLRSIYTYFLFSQLGLWTLFTYRKIKTKLALKNA